MRIIIAARRAVAFAVTNAFLTHDQRIVAVVKTPSELREAVRRERPAAVVVAGTFGETPEGLRALLEELCIPALLRGAADPAVFAGVAQVLAEDTPWAQVVQAAADLPQPEPRATGSQAPALAAPAPTATPSTTESDPAAPFTVTPQPHPAPQGLPAPAFQPLCLYPTLGGVGTSSLALALAAAGAEVGLRSLALSADPVAGAARWGLPLGETGVLHAVSEHLTVGVAQDLAWVPRGGYDLAVWDLRPAMLTPDLPQNGTVALLTRPSGEGRLATTQVLAEAARREVKVGWLVIVGHGSLAPQEFVARCADYGVHLPWVALPYDPQVPLLDAVQGHALMSPRYGPAVRQVARRIWPELAWPVAENNGGRVENPQASGPSVVQRLITSATSFIEITE